MVPANTSNLSEMSLEIKTWADVPGNQERLLAHGAPACVAQHLRGVSLGGGRRQEVGRVRLLVERLRFLLRDGQVLPRLRGPLHVVVRQGLRGANWSLAADRNACCHLRAHVPEVEVELLDQQLRLALVGGHRAQRFERGPVGRGVVSRLLNFVQDSERHGRRASRRPPQGPTGRRRRRSRLAAPAAAVSWCCCGRAGRLYALLFAVH